MSNIVPATNAPVTQISPEGLEIAQAYLRCWSIPATAKELNLSVEAVEDFICKKEVKRFIDGVFMEQGYGNRFALRGILDEAIEQKLEEARESEQFTNKDLIDLITLSHKMQMDHLNAMAKTGLGNTGTTNNVQVNSYGENYGDLMSKIMLGKG